MATWSLHLSYSKHNSNLWKSSSFRTEHISRRSNMEIPRSVSLLGGLELCTSHVRSISTKPLTRAAELCDAVPKGACFSKKSVWKISNFRENSAKILQNVAKSAKFCRISKISATYLIDFEKCCKTRIYTPPLGGKKRKRFGWPPKKIFCRLC